MKLFSRIFTSAILLVFFIQFSGCAHSKLAPEAESSTAADDSFTGEPGDGKFPVIDAHTHNHFTNKPERTSKIPDNLEQYLK